MINLLHSPLPESEIAAILAASAGRPALPPLGDAAWSAVRDNPAVTSWLAPLTTRAGAEAGEPLESLTDELYADFFKTGARLPFENVYFERRRRLGRAAMAVLLGDNATRARLLPSFLKKLGEIMDEESWSLPAHVWSEPTGKNPWMIDLFAAETANNLADLLVVFAAVIPPALAQRIKTRLHVQIFENYVNPRAKFHWPDITNNWNAVCHQGVLGAALAIEEDHALVARMLSLAAGRLPAFLSGYGSDGATSEGPGYWSYGFGWFAELNAQLEHRTRGQLSVLEGDTKVAAIARFAPQVTLAGGHFVNFSDGGRTGRLSPSLLTYLGQRLADPILTAQGAALYRSQADTGLDLNILRTDFFFLTRLALRAPAPAQLAAAREPVHPDVFFDDYGAIVTRGTDARGHLWEFAAKGGHNAEHHNHNDCGSFLLNIDGAPALIEIGAPEYTRAFFSDKRYEFLAARSLGHSVPFVNGCEQPAGPEFAATVLKVEVGGNRIEFKVDLTKCYPPAARCKKLHRAWVFEKSAGILSVTDTFELDGPGSVESMLICQDPVTREGPDALIATPKAVLRIVPSAGTTLGAIEICDYRGHHGTDEKINRARFAPLSLPATTGSIGYKITLA
ncbi:MAG: heparinase [Rariglobus sp.]|jgi:hypothetical protein|nr:heparinase [Rariglobus sp.]